MSAPESNAAPRGTGRRYAWAVVGMLWFICCFNYADRQAISVVFPALKAEFGFNKEQLGWIGSAFMWVYAGAAPLAGWAGDRLQRRHLILGGCLFWSFVTLTTAWCSKLWQFITVRALEGFGETFYYPASMSLVSAYHGKGTRSRAMAFHQSSVYLGTIGGSWAGALMAQHYGWRIGFYCFGGLGMLLAAMLYLFLREPAPEAQSEAGGATGSTPMVAMPFRDTVRLMASDPSARLICLAFVLANFVAGLFLVWTPTFLMEKFGYKLGAAGLTATLFIHAASAVAVPLAGWLADSGIRRHPGARMFVQAAGLLLGAGCVAWVGWTKDRSALIVAMTAFGVCKGFYDSGIFASLYDVVPANARATAAGLLNTVGWTGGALGPWYAGMMAVRAGRGSETENMSLAVSLCGVAYLAGALCLAAAGRAAGLSSTPPTQDSRAG